MNERQPKLYGATGEVGVDGILNLEQSARLDRLQRDTVREAWRRLDEHRPGELFPMAAMATGIGKGRIIHLVIEEQMRRKPDSRVMVIAGTKNMLVGQMQQSLNGYQEEQYVKAEDQEELTEATEIGENPLAGQSSRLYKVGRMGKRGTNVKVETIQKLVSLHNRGDLFPEYYDLLIADEVHNVGTPARKEVAQRFRKVVGFTATAHRNSGVLRHPEDYGFKIFTDYPLPQAQEDGLLPPFLGMRIETKGLIDLVPTNREGGIDYPALEKLLKASPRLRPYIADKLTDIIWPNDNTRYKTVVAVNYVWEAQEMAKLLYARGINVGLLINANAARELHTDEIPATNSLERYFLPHDHPDAVQALISPYVAGEGFDAPFTEVLCWASPTDSGLRYGQYNGRLSRRANGKSYGIVVDCLYQTTQYRWSYNMSTWMKGNVKQLNNGLLYVGADRDMGNISNQKDIGRLSVLNEGSIFSGDVHEEFASLQPDDLSLTSSNLSKIFKGKQQRLVMLAADFQRVNEVAHPEFFAIRQSSRLKNQVVITAEGAGPFIEFMKGWDIIERQVLEVDLVDTVPEGSIAVTGISLQRFFEGNHQVLKNKSVRAVEAVREAHPEWVVKQKRSGSIIDFVTPDGHASFFQALHEQGVIAKPIVEQDGVNLQLSAPLEKVKQGEIGTIGIDLEKVFKGKRHVLESYIKDFRELYGLEHPEYFDRRLFEKRAPSDVVTLAGREALLAYFEQKGIRRKEEFDLSALLQSGANDVIAFRVTAVVTQQLFIGETNLLMLARRSVIAELIALQIDGVVMQKANNGAETATITTVAALNLFVEKMQEHGLRLRKPIQEQDGL